MCILFVGLRSQRGLGQGQTARELERGGANSDSESEGSGSRPNGSSSIFPCSSMAHMDPVVPLPPKRKRSAVAREGLPLQVLVFSKAEPVGGRAAVSIHGAITLRAARPLASTSQHASIEQQRSLSPGPHTAFEFDDPIILDSPCILSGDDVAYSGNTGTFRRHAMLDVMRSLGLRGRGWLKSVRIDARVAWAVKHKRLPALVLPRDVSNRLGLKLGTEAVYENCDGCQCFEASSDRYLTTAVTTCPSTNPNRPVRYTLLPEVILRAWMLRRMLKAGTDMIKIFQLAMRMVFTASALKEVQERMEQVEHQLPRKSILDFACHRLVTLDMLYQRELGARFAFARHWSPDSSPQGGYDFFVVIEERCKWPLQSSIEERLAMQAPIEAWQGTNSCGWPSCLLRRLHPLVWCTAIVYFVLRRRARELPKVSVLASPS